jgi:hypothetical protein
MKIKFDKDKCLKLLKERKSLQKEGKLLRDYDKAKNDELISYLSLIEDQIFWKSRKEYIQILDLFVSKKITLEQLFKQFCGLRGSNLRSARMWKEKLEEEAFVVFPKSTEINIQFNPKSCGFTKIISYLHSLVDAWNPDVTLEMNLKQPELLWYGISEEYLRLRMEKYFLPQLEKYCNKS